MTNDEIAAILKGAKIYNWTTEPARTPEESADPNFFYGVRDIADVLRAIRPVIADVSGVSSSRASGMASARHTTSASLSDTTNIPSVNFKGLSGLAK